MTRAPLSVSTAADSSRSTSSSFSARISLRSTVGEKPQSSLAVEGELPEEGRAAIDDGDDLMLALAKRTVHGDSVSTADTESV